jgi:hypothetical protein
VKAGDSITLTCELRETVGKPEFVFWFHNNTMINFQVGATLYNYKLQDNNTMIKFQVGAIIYHYKLQDNILS